MISFHARLIHIVFAISIGVASLVVASPTYATTSFPGKNGKVVFARATTDSSTIWTMNINGTDQKRLTGYGAHTPVWSPGGSKIAYIDEGRLRVMDADGSNKRTLTQQKNNSESSPVWTADGARIAFVRVVREGNKERRAVFSIRPNGSNETNVSGWSATKNYRSPSWSPSGSRIAYEEYNETSSRLLIKNLKDASVRELVTLSDVTESADVSWSPSGKRILYNDSYGQVYTIWPDGSHRTVISDGENYGASWSPDGKKIAFIEDFSGEYVSISEEDGTVSWIPINKTGYLKSGHPVWSPDGTKLLFTMSSENASDVFLLDSASEDLVTILSSPTHVQQLNWQAKQ